MRIVLDENLSGRRLAARLQAGGHDVVLVDDVGLLGFTDPRIWTWAIGQDRLVRTRDIEDDSDLHQLIMAARGHHSGLLLIRFDDNPRHNMTERGIATALGKLAASGAPLADQVHVLNHWR
jgi:predicted nuclease of predicted toxin-antitoxin system